MNNSDQYENNLQKAIQNSLIQNGPTHNTMYESEEILLKKAIEDSLFDTSIEKIINKCTVSATDDLMKKVLKKLNLFQQSIFNE